MSEGRGRRPSEWLNALETGVFATLYGKANHAERAAVIRSALKAFSARFGDEHAVRLYRAPGRINLRGMHVDLHGGWLNLMTHHRETVVAAAPHEGAGRLEVTNADPAHEAVIGAISDPPRATKGWAGYVWGAALRGGLPLGMRAAVHGDVPQGSSLSSSASLCVALLEAAWGLRGAAPSYEDRIAAAQEAEWHAGARVGLSDQTAILLGRRDALLSIALDPARPDTSCARHIPWPEGAEVLVIDSGLHRKLSGGARDAYIAARFSYSMALGVLQRAMGDMGMDAGRIALAGRLATVTDALSVEGFYTVLSTIPMEAPLSHLRKAIGVEAVASAWKTVFPDREPDEDRLWPLRGPLLFGVAESERARMFGPAVAAGDWTEAGRLMCIGHDGDRVSRAVCAVDDATVEAWARSSASIADRPGIFSASVPALDAIVDAATEAGAYGACLTGAGLGGSVLALCPAPETERIAQSLRAYLKSDDYGTLAPGAVGEGVVVNRATAGAGELVF